MCNVHFCIVPSLLGAADPLRAWSCFPSSPATPSVASIFLLSSYIRNPLSYGEAPSSHLHFRREYTGANA